MTSFGTFARSCRLPVVGDGAWPHRVSAAVRQSLLSTSLRLPGSSCHFSTRVMSIVSSHSLCNLLRGECAVRLGMRYIAWYVSLGFRFNFHSFSLVLRPPCSRPLARPARYRPVTYDSRP